MPAAGTTNTSTNLDCGQPNCSALTRRATDWFCFGRGPLSGELSYCDLIAHEVEHYCLDHSVRGETDMDPYDAATAAVMGLESATCQTQVDVDNLMDSDRGRAAIYTASRLTPIQYTFARVFQALGRDAQEVDELSKEEMFGACCLEDALAVTLGYSLTRSQSAQRFNQRREAAVQSKLHSLASSGWGERDRKRVAQLYGKIAARTDLNSAPLIMSGGNEHRPVISAARFNNEHVERCLTFEQARRLEKAIESGPEEDRKFASALANLAQLGTFKSSSVANYGMVTEAMNALDSAYPDAGCPSSWRSQKSSNE